MLERNQYRIRRLAETDLKKLFTWRNSGRVRRNMITNHLILWEEHIKWFHRHRVDQTAEYYIFETRDKPLGLISFTGIDLINNNCTWGFYLGEEKQPPGTGLIMGRLGLDHAFSNLQMHKVYGQVLMHNVVSIKYHLKLGFSQEANFKEHIKRDDIYVDLFVFGIPKDDWAKKRSEFI